ncbi:MAG: hypothetical protein ACKOT0_03945 [bacterium]
MLGRIRVEGDHGVDGFADHGMGLDRPFDELTGGNLAIPHECGEPERVVFGVLVRAHPPTLG